MSSSTTIVRTAFINHTPVILPSWKSAGSSFTSANRSRHELRTPPETRVKIIPPFPAVTNAPSMSSSKRRHSPNKDSQPKHEQQQQRPPKRTTTLLRALVQLKVASQETCLFLIQQSCVRVNGELVTNEKMTVNRMEDRIFVNDRDFGTAEYGTDHVDQWEQRAPRTHRDRMDSETSSLTRNFNHSIDGGFFSYRKYRAGA